MSTLNTDVGQYVRCVNFDEILYSAVPFAYGSTVAFHNIHNNMWIINECAEEVPT